MKNPVTVDFIYGYLTAIADLCHGTDYVPIYGAEEVEINGGNVNQALIRKYGRAVGRISRREEDTKALLSILLERWVNEKLFEGMLKAKSVSTRHQLYNIRGCLQECIEGVVSTEHVAYRFRLNHAHFGHETEGLCFHGNGRCILMYFGYSD